jgi:hypothetical protein
MASIPVIGDSGRALAGRQKKSRLRRWAASNTIEGLEEWRRTQVAKGEVCKTSMQRFKSARRLQEDSFPLAPYFRWYPAQGQVL